MNFEIVPMQQYWKFNIHTENFLADSLVFIKNAITCSSHAPGDVLEIVLIWQWL